MQSIQRNIKVFFWAEFFGSISFITPVITLFYLHRGLEYPDLFIMMLIWVITTFFLEVPTGTFGDKYGPKAAFITGHLIKIISILLLVIAFDKWLFYLSSCLAALSFTFFSGSDQAFIYESLKEMKREDEMSKVWGRIHSATIFPSVVTILLGAYFARELQEEQFVLIIILGLIFNILKFILIFFLKEPAAFSFEKKKHTFDFVKVGINNIFAQKNLLLLFTNECLVMIPTYVVLSNENLIQPFFVSSGIPVILIGAIYSLDALLSSFVLNSVKFFENILGKKNLIYMTGIIIGSAFLSGYLFEPGIFIAIYLFFSVKIFFWLRYPLFQQIKNDYIPSNSRATTLSLLSMVDSTFDVFILGSIYLGAVNNLGIQNIFLVCSLIIFTGLLFPVRIKNPPLSREVNK